MSVLGVDRVLEQLRTFQYVSALTSRCHIISLSRWRLGILGSMLLN